MVQNINILPFCIIFYINRDVTELGYGDRESGRYGYREAGRYGDRESGRFGNTCAIEIKSKFW
jgi:hypothetical protein